MFLLLWKDIMMKSTLLRKHLIGQACSLFLRFRPLSQWLETWRHGSRRGDGAVAESLWQATENGLTIILSKAGAKETSKSTVTITGFLQQGLTHFNGATAYCFTLSQWLLFEPLARITAWWEGWFCSPRQLFLKGT